jgi:hypothetical protein
MYVVSLRNRGSWSAPLLGSAIVVDEDLAEACLPGIVRFEAGDYWNAAHSLVPQLERDLRSLGRLVGADHTRSDAMRVSAGRHWSSCSRTRASQGHSATLVLRR